MRTPFDYLNARYQDAVDYEQIVDRVIDAAGKSAGKSPITISTRHWPQFCVDEIVNRYSAAGWKIEHVSDARDGDFLQLEIPPLTVEQVREVMR